MIVTILITVLTNSFMAVVQNANEEHQFVFAVNTISMVKSDALFSYVAPTNVLAWLLVPMRFFIPFRKFVRINRTVIKATHFPVLLAIYAYERLVLSGKLYERTDLVERPSRRDPAIGALETSTAGIHLFSPKLNRLREPSVATFQKDRALDEVFRRPFRDNTIRGTQKSQERRKASNVVNRWMLDMGSNGTASPPLEQDRAVVDRLEARRDGHRRSQLALRNRQTKRIRDFTEATSMSVVSDPEDFIGNGSTQQPFHLRQQTSRLPTMTADGLNQTDADGDDELVTNDEEDLITLDRQISNPPLNTIQRTQNQASDYFQQTPVLTSRNPHFETSNVTSNEARPSPPKQLAAVRTFADTPPKRRRHHDRIPSATTIVYDPPTFHSSPSTSSPSRKAITARNSAKNTRTATPNNLSTSTGRRTPKRISAAGPTQPRPIMPPRTAFQSAPDLAGTLAFNTRRGRRSSLTLDLGSDLGDNKAVGGGFVGALPATSFVTQMEFAAAGMRARKAAQREEDSQSRMSKLVLARMNALEEGFRDLIKEVKDMRRDDGEGKSKGIMKVRSKKEDGGETRPGRDPALKKEADTMHRPTSSKTENQDH